MFSRFTASQINIRKFTKKKNKVYNHILAGVLVDEKAESLQETVIPFHILQFNNQRLTITV